MHFAPMREIHRIAALSILTLIITLLSACASSAERHPAQSCADILTDSISRIVADAPGNIGVAVITDKGDTAVVNNDRIYPMMSVFKMHQAIAVCDMFDHNGTSLDTVLTMKRTELDPHTWSPMLKEHTGAEISLPVRELLQYTLVQSDNNASNVMFGRLCGITRTDSLIATIIPRESFRIAYTEREMSADHDKAYVNRTSPLGAAMLIRRLFTDSLVSAEKQEFIKATLGQCATGSDRIVAPLLGKEGVTVAHKTGSGYINEKGQLAAHNDVAYVRTSDGSGYALAVLVSDFNGPQAEASEYIARISAAVYSILTGN